MIAMPRFAKVLLGVVAFSFIAAGPALARQTPEQKCQRGRYEAAAKYSSCQQKLWGKYFGGAYPGMRDFSDKFLPALTKCRVRYTDTWTKLQAKALGTGASCDRARFEDNGDGTVTDWLTGLQWEKKTDDATVHDKDRQFSWSTYDDVDGTNQDGTVFTTFLATLDHAPCFAGQCGWRLPTLSELQTILRGPYPCETGPCIDVIFGPSVTDTAYVWSESSYPNPTYVWAVDFASGRLVGYAKTVVQSARAVRPLQ